MGCTSGECIAGFIRGDVKECDWKNAVEAQRERVEEFITSKRALHHPGFIIPHAYCVNCGKELEIHK